MKKDTTTKKVWQKPEVSDLDIHNTAKRPYVGETSYDAPPIS
jgi:hypothetical protein